MPAPLRREEKLKTREPRPARLALLVSFCLHLGALLLVVCILPHHQGAPLTQRPVTIIALQTLSQTAPAPRAASPYQPSSVPRHRQRPAVVKAASPAWQAPPSTTPPADPAPAPSSAIAEAAPAPPAAQASGSAAPPAASTAADTVANQAFANQAPPLAYLTEVSRMIRVNLSYPSQAHSHGVAVVHIRIARDGTVLDAGVIHSSGNPALDEEARAVVLRIGKFPEPPSAYFPEAGDFGIDQPIRFLG